MDDLRDRDILILDAAGHSRNLLRQILLLLGFTRVTCASRTTDALAMLRDKFFHVVFCDENVVPHTPAEFMKALRCDLSTANVVIPAVLVSTAARYDKVSEWRDAGGNDVIVKPVSMEVIKQRIASLILNPKAFVTTRTFIGPDRRRDDRRQEGERNPSAADRRSGHREARVFGLTRAHTADGADDRG